MLGGVQHRRRHAKISVAVVMNRSCIGVSTRACIIFLDNRCQVLLLHNDLSSIRKCCLTVWMVTLERDSADVVAAEDLHDRNAGKGDLVMPLQIQAHSRRTVAPLLAQAKNQSNHFRRNPIPDSFRPAGPVPQALWVRAASVNGKTRSEVCAASTTFPCWDMLHPLSVNVQGAVNTVSVTDPIPMPGQTSPSTLDPFTFGEALINLQATGVFPATITDPSENPC